MLGKTKHICFKLDYFEPKLIKVTKIPQNIPSYIFLKGCIFCQGWMQIENVSLGIKQNFNRLVNFFKL